MQDLNNPSPPEPNDNIDGVKYYDGAFSNHIPIIKNNNITFYQSFFFKHKEYNLENPIHKL